MFCRYSLLNLASYHHTHTHTHTHTHQHSIVFVNAEACLWHPSITLTDTSASHEAQRAHRQPTVLFLSACISHSIPGEKGTLGTHTLTYFSPLKPASLCSAWKSVVLHSEEEGVVKVWSSQQNKGLKGCWIRTERVSEQNW